MTKTQKQTKCVVISKRSKNSQTDGFAIPKRRQTYKNRMLCQKSTPKNIENLRFCDAKKRRKTSKTLRFRHKTTPKNIEQPNVLSFVNAGNKNIG